MPYKDKERKAAQYKVWREANKEQLAASKKAYFQANKEKITAKQKVHREANKDKIALYRYANREKRRAQAKVWRETNKERRLIYQRAYYAANKERLSLENKAWRQANKEHLAAYCDRHKERMKSRAKMYREANRERATKRQLERIKTNLQYKIRMRLARRFNLSLRRANTKKTAKTLSLIGCSIQDLMVFLQAYFTPGMDWDNYGQQTWNIDHIRPCASYDLTDINQQRLCFHWSNLKPILAHENFIKGSKWNGQKSFYSKNNE